MSDEIERAVQDFLEAQMKDDFVKTAFGLTNLTSIKPREDLTLDKLKEMIHEWGKIVREYRRNEVTLVVDMAHSGPMIISRHPTEGHFIECTWRQAQFVHERTPLVLYKVISEHVAHFHIATPFHGPFLKTLPMPPYDLPEVGEKEE